MEIEKETQQRLSYSSVRRFLNRNNIFAFSHIKKPFLNATHIKNRLEAGKTWIKMSKEETDSILFSDESKFNLLYNDGKVFCLA